MSWFVPWVCCGGLSGPRIEPYRMIELSQSSLERHDEPFLMSLEPRIRSMFLQRLQVDTRMDSTFLPIVYNTSSRNVQPTFFGIFELREIFTKNFRSVVMEVDDSNTVIKYTHNCGIADYVHPLVMNAWVGAKAALSGIGPRINTLSAPRRMIADDFLTFGFVMSQETALRCAGASLRYLVMSRPSGQSIASRNLFGLREAIGIGREIFASLKVMHALANPHGTLSEETVFVDRAGSVQLIDFGYISAMEDLTQMSPWEIQKSVYSFRDDAFRAIRIIASMINGVHAYREYEDQILERSGIEGILEWKLEKNVFQISKQVDPIARAIGNGNRPLVREVSRSILFLLSLVERMNEDPSDIPFDEIIEILDGIEKVLDVDRITDVRNPSFTN